MLTDSSAVRAHRCASGGKRGERNQAIGRSRGGRTTKIHALTDGLCRPIAFLLTGGQVADCTAGGGRPPARADAGEPRRLEEIAVLLPIYDLLRGVFFAGPDAAAFVDTLRLLPRPWAFAAAARKAE